MDVPAPDVGPRDYAWAVLAACAALMLVGSVGATGWGLITLDRPMALTRTAAAVFFWYWIAAGAWLRTAWGRAALEAAPDVPPSPTGGGDSNPPPAPAP